MAKKKPGPIKGEGGAPRKHDRDQVARDLIEWAKKPDSINLCKFCAYYEPIIPPSKMSLCIRIQGPHQSEPEKLISISLCSVLADCCALLKSVSHPPFEKRKPLKRINKSICIVCSV